MEKHEGNRRAWDKLAGGNSVFAKVATDAECRQPLKILDSRGWLPKSVEGQKVLCLASGGGWQSILYASAGADVTVVDISNQMLELDRREAARRNLRITAIRASMDDLSILPPSHYDIVHQPVSTCYVPDVCRVYAEIARVTRPGGIYISQHKQPSSLQVSHRNDRHLFVIGVEYYHAGPLPGVRDSSYRESGTTEYLHRWEDLVGGLCRAGFVLEALTEPKRADPTADVTQFGYRGRWIPPYVRLKARRLSDATEQESDSSATSGIWIP